MRLPRRVFLNPCDYLLYTDHMIRMRRRQGPNIAFMCVDIDGELNGERMRRSIARAMAQSPTTLSSLRHSVFGGWPFWRIPRDLDAAAQRAVDSVYRLVDAGDSLDDGLATTGESPSDLREGPQIRITHYAPANGKSRVCIRWPHWLMDAAGALAFLGLWAESYAETGNESLPNGDASNGVRQWRPLAGIGLPARWRTLRTQPSAVGHAGRRVGSPCDETTAGELHDVQSHRVLHRCWNADRMDRIRENAKRDVPAGPARITRYLAVSVLRALHQLFEENDWAGDAYRITLPMRMRGGDDADASVPLRFGNYLASPLLVFNRPDAGDTAKLAESLNAQLRAYLEAHGDRAQWTLMSLAGLLPFFAHRWLFSHPKFRTTFSSGFSFYGELHPPLRNVGDLPITNLWGGGPTTIPPGMNPVFSRFVDSLNLSLTYSWPIVSDEIAQRYIDLIEHHVLL